jgi:hypothetical protein
LIENGGVTHNFESGPPKDHFKPNLAGMVSGWVPSKSVSDSPTLHSKWLLLLKIEIPLVVNFRFIIWQDENYENGYYNFVGLVCIAC